MIIQREITRSIKSLATRYPVTALTGSRQSGKTTPLKQLIPDYEYLSLENLDVREFAQTDTKGFLKRYAKYMIFDDVKRIPAFFRTFKVL